ncbi:MAG: Copper-repressible polypeptide [Pseudomonadota bacterium]
MKLYKKSKLVTVFSSLLLAASFQAGAATSILANSTIVNLTGGTGTATFEKITGASWVSESMGYLGWTHFGRWGFVTLSKGKPVTIVADATAIAGFHPGITVWHRKTSVSLPTALPTAPATGVAPTPVQALFYMNDHFYDQASSISVLNATDEMSGVKLGSINMEYVASGFDMDGLGDKFTLDSVSGMLRPYDAAKDSTAAIYGPYLPMGYATTGLANSQKLSDAASATGVTPVVAAKTPGRLALTFTPKATGVYQFALGGLKPDVGSAAAVNANKFAGTVHSINVTITQK